MVKNLTSRMRLKLITRFIFHFWFPLWLAKLIFSSQTGKGCRLSSSITDHVLARHVLKERFAKNFLSCIVECENEGKCFSINYLTSSAICHLNNATNQWYPEDLIEKTGATYIDILVRTYSPCADRRPPCTERCIPLRSSRKSRCICSRGTHCGYSECSPHPLGMESDTIPNDKISASSEASGQESWKARLNHGTHWTPIQDDNKQYFQISFRPYVKVLTGITTQGHPSKWWWIETYKIKYKLGSTPWIVYQENGVDKVIQGNKKFQDISGNNFSQPFEADAIRILPRRFHGRIALRLELYGC